MIQTTRSGSTRPERASVRPIASIARRPAPLPAVRWLTTTIQPLSPLRRLRTSGLESGSAVTAPAGKSRRHSTYLRQDFPLLAAFCCLDRSGVTQKGFQIVLSRRYVQCADQNPPPCPAAPFTERERLRAPEPSRWPGTGSIPALESTTRAPPASEA
jgi:hypothetical protein